LPNPEFVSKLQRSDLPGASGNLGFRSPGSVNSSRVQTPQDLDVELSNYIADMDEIREKNSEDLISETKVVVWPPVSEGRTDTPEFLTPPPSYATENYSSDQDQQIIQHSQNSKENKLNSNFESFQNYSSSQQYSIQDSHSKSSSFRQSSSQLTQKSSSQHMGFKQSSSVTPIDLLDEMSWNLTKSTSGNQEIIKSPVNKRQKTSRSKYSRDSLAELDAQITDIQTQFEAELDNLIRIAGRYFIYIWIAGRYFIYIWIAGRYFIYIWIAGRYFIYISG